MLQGFNRHAVTPMLQRSGEPPWVATTCPGSVAAAVAAVKVGSSDVVICAAGAGDVPLGWLAAGAGAVVAVGTPIELALVALKASALARLRAIERRQLWGLEAAGRRVWLLHEAARGMEAPERAFWRTNEAWVREGLDGAGRLERRIGPRWAPRGPGRVARELAWRRICHGATLVVPGLVPPAGARARWLFPSNPVLSDPWSARVLSGAWGPTPPAWLRPDCRLGDRVGQLERVDKADLAALAAALARATVIDRTGLGVEIPDRCAWVRRSWGTNAAADGSPWGGGLEVGRPGVSPLTR